MKAVKTSKKGELTIPHWSDLFADLTLPDKWPFHGRDLFPAMNVKESDEAFQTEMAAPGFSKKDFKISVEGSYLTISAEKENEKTESNERYTKKEFEQTSFSRTFNLPHNIDEDKIVATYNDGILHLNIPKKEKSKTSQKKKIKIS